MAITGSPTLTESESPSVSGFKISFGTSTFSTTMSVEGSSPTTSASSLAPLEKRTDTPSACDTTWWLVTTWPSSSNTNPDPPPGPMFLKFTSTLTTPGPSRVYTSRTEGPSSPSGSTDATGASLIATSLESLSNPERVR